MRLAVVIVVLVAVRAEAHAQTRIRASTKLTCACPAEVRVPERGATGLPANAKLWRIDRFGAVHYPTRVPTRQLMGVHVRDRVPATAGEPDTNAPAAPRDVTVTMWARGWSASPLSTTSWMSIAGLSIDAFHDDDVALVRIDIRDDHGIVSLLTTPDRALLCDADFYVTRDDAIVEVRAIDLAGNESEPTTIGVVIGPASLHEYTCTPGGARYSEPCRREHDDRAGCVQHRKVYGDRAGILIGCYVLFLLGWMTLVGVRGGRMLTYPVEPIGRLIAEGVAHRMLRWYVTSTAMLVLGSVGLYAAGASAAPWVLAPLGVAAIVRLLRARRLQRLLEDPQAVTVRREKWLVVQTPGEMAKLRATNADFVEAARSGIPRSEVR
jgi:hypothetical protein